MNAQGELVGYTVEIDDRKFQLNSFLGRHADASETYRSRRGTQHMVVRIYRRSFNKEPLLLLGNTNAPYVRTYTSAGPAQLQPPAADLISRRRRPAWVAIRQYVPNTLKDVLSATPSALELNPLSIAVDIARGLSTLHQHGIIHGDLRPSNVRMHTDRSAELLDYGLGFHRRARTSEALHLAPEYLMSGGAISPSADVYSFGKLLRLVSQSASMQHQPQMGLLHEVIERCLEIDPVARPSIADVIDWLQSESKVDWSSEQLRELRVAVAADIDARVPYGVAESSGNFLARLVAASCDRVAVDLARYASPRAAGLNKIEMVHFLSTITLMDRRSRRVASPHLGGEQLVLRGVEMSFESSERAGGADSGSFKLDASAVDDQWRAEIEENVRQDVAGRHFSRSAIESRIADQLDGASSVMESVLSSDVFLNSQEVAGVMSGRCSGITPDEVRVLKDLGYLLSLPVSGRNLYPLFQFDRDGLPLAVIKEVADASAPATQSTWSSAAWWFLQHARLFGQSPVEWLRTRKDPKSVLGVFLSAVA